MMQSMAFRGARVGKVFQAEEMLDVAEGIDFSWIGEHLHRFAATFVSGEELSGGDGPWPLRSFPAMWYVVAAVLCMQSLEFPDAVNLAPVSL